MSESLPVQRELAEIHFEKGQITAKSVLEGMTAGRVQYEKDTKLFPMYSLNNLDVYPKYQGKGYATQLMKAFEDMCVREKIPALVVDGIGPKRNREAAGLYKRRGWLEVPAPPSLGSNKVYVFNLQPGQTVEQVSRRWPDA